jgi:hypothetical protein
MKNYLVKRIFSTLVIILVTAFSAQCVWSEPAEEPPEKKWFTTKIQGLADDKLPRPGGELALFTSTHQSPADRLMDNTGSTSSDGVLDDRIYFAQAQKKASTGPEKGEKPSLEKIAKAMDNPLGSLWLLVVQNDLSYLKSDLIDGGEWFNSFKIMPVLPMRLTENWNLINRPILQIQSSPLDSDVGNLFGLSPTEITANPGLTSIAQDPIGRTTGFGDMVFFSMVSPRKADEGFVWGVGPTFIFPTASHDVLGQGKWQAGPAALGVNLGKKWNIGALAQQWFSLGGDDNRPDTSQMDIQYFANYKWDPLTLVGMTPNIRINWEADEGEKISFPVGLGIIKTAQIGKVPMRYGIEFQYYVIKPDLAGPEFNIKLFVIPVVPGPKWSRSPIL